MTARIWHRSIDRRRNMPETALPAGPGGDLHRTRSRRLGALLAVAMAAFGLAAGPAAAFEPGEAVASIKPIHSLVAAIMDGVGTPQLIVKGGGSPHAYTLRPSEARALDSARIVFMVSHELEAFLTGPLAALAGGAEIVELAEAPGVTLLAPREGEAFEAHDHGDEAGHADEHAHEDEHKGEQAHDDEHGHGAHDPHLWLDPKNAEAMAGAIAAALAKVDPEHAALYAANEAKLKARLAETTAKIEAMLEPVRGARFVVFHDAYQYFEARFGMAAAGAITLNPQAQPGARGIAAVRARIAETGAACVFSEPQFEPRLVSVVIEGTGARSGVLDPIGADLADGPDLYVALLERNAEALVDCLGAK